ncbi:MAG: DUF1998 domain-containing protein [Bacillota bacterium]
MSNKKDEKLLDKTTHNVRRGQIVLQYGIGAMIDFPSQVLMTAAVDVWGKCQKVHDERLEKFLGVNGFVSPLPEHGVAFSRFPRWYFCPKCRIFQPIEKWKADNSKRNSYDEYMVKKLVCNHCNVELVPARVVVACEAGHIDDFPWVKWVHAKSFGSPKHICQNPRLKISTGGTASSGLDGIVIECVNCKAKASLQGAFDKDVFMEMTKNDKIPMEFYCTGNHPWKHEKESCGEFSRTFQRGSSSVYFPKTISSLVIPPYSSILNSKVEDSLEYSKFIVVLEEMLEDDYDSVEEKTKDINKKIDRYAEKIAAEIACEINAVKVLLRRKYLSEKVDENTDDKELKYKYEEYQALTGIIPAQNLEEDEFYREGKDGSLYNIPSVESVALIHKVKEVSALVGFSRIMPTIGMDHESRGFVSVKGEKVNATYPATSYIGEGIFIELKYSDICQWIKSAHLESRSIKLKEKYKDSYFCNKQLDVDGVLVFMHTLSHLLLKELSYNCGYTLAALKERIYYGEVDGKRMCGIFLYTTGGDSQGTLGGLVRQGQPDCLPLIFRKAIESAQFCANDPVCSFSEGQGIESLNLAACHACVLVPETCCELGNLLLDRVPLIGKMDDVDIGYYSTWINN